MRGLFYSIRSFMNSAFKRRGVDFLLLALYSFALGLFLLLLQPNGTREVVALMNVRLVLLNVFPILIVVYFLYFISSCPKVAVFVSYALFSIFALVNRTKIYYRKEPFVPVDLQLGVEGVLISAKSKYVPDVFSLVQVAVVLAILIAFMYGVRRTKLSRALRIGGALICVIASFVAYSFMYSQDVIYDGLAVSGNMFNAVDCSNSKGSLYYFIHNIKYTSIRMPENYDVSEFSQIKYDMERRDAPNVIVIMGEAFTDLSELPIFEFEQGKNPIENYKKLCDESVAYGHIITPTFGGGTADTEFTVLASALSFVCSPNNSYPFNSVHKNTDSIARIFASQGYHTRAFHPGYSWFYKRQSVYPFMGFEDSFFVDEVNNELNKGQYYSEKSTYDDFIGRLEKSLNDGEKIFDYMVTIQNHGPYERSKYGEIYDYKTNMEISTELYDCFGSYFIGINDMDDELARLAEFLRGRDEPVVLVYYGDHLPSLAGHTDSYELIGHKVGHESFDDDYNFFATPYVIWANESAKPYIDSAKAKYGEYDMSSNYIGAYLLELIGLDKVSPYIEFTNSLREKLPIITPYYIYDGEQPCGMLSYRGEHYNDFEKYKRWQYYRITNRFDMY